MNAQTPTRRLGRLAAATLALALALASIGVGDSAAPASAATGADHYVSCVKKGTGGTGTRSKPWRSLAAVAKHGSFAPGDRILLKRGTTCAGRLALKGSGTALAPIVLGAYGTGKKPTIAAGGSANGTGAVQLTNQSYWTVQDLRITNTTGRWNPKTYRAGLLFRSTTKVRQFGLVAQRLTIEHVDSNPGGKGDTRAYGGIAAQTTTKGIGFDGMLIRNNVITGVGRTGIAIFNRAYSRSSDVRLRITGNTVKRSRGDGIVISGTDFARIDNNTVAYGSNLSSCSRKQCGRMGGPSTASAGIWPTMSSHVRIDHNEVYGMHKAAGDGSGIDVDLGANDVLVERNYLHDNERGGVMFCGARDTTVRFNVLEHNEESAIWFTCGWQKDQRPKNITLTNNTIVADRTARWVVRNVHPHPGKNIRFTNNLVYCTGSCAYTWPNRPYAANNTYVGARSKTEPKGAGTRHSNPGLKAPGTARVGFKTLGGYKLKKGAKPGTGVRIAAGAVDIFGTKVNTKRPLRGATQR